MTVLLSTTEAIYIRDNLHNDAVPFTHSQIGIKDVLGIDSLVEGSDVYIAVDEEEEYHYKLVSQIQEKFDATDSFAV